MRWERLANVIVVLSFAAAIAAPALQEVTDFLPKVQVVDNRELVPFPTLGTDFKTIIALPGRLQTWYADHMGLRGALVTAYRWLNDDLLRSPDKVVIGRNHWLYLRKGLLEDVETAPLIRDWCGRDELTAPELDKWVAAITANRDWLAKRGIDYLLVIPPNKLSVLPQHRPAWFRCRRGTTRLDQLESALRQRSGIEIVDFRDVLRRAAQAGDPVWFRTDTHWSPRGVAAAYPSLLARIHALLPAAGEIDSFDIGSRGTVLGDLGRMIDVDGLVPDIDWTVRPRARRSHVVPTPFPDQADLYGRRSSARAVDDPSLPTALVFHDSFFDGAMDDFLAESFSRTVFVFYGRPEIERRLVAEDDPDIVIQEMVERNLLHSFFHP